MGKSLFLLFLVKVAKLEFELGLPAGFLTESAERPIPDRKVVGSSQTDGEYFYGVAKSSLCQK